jgi:hypothetical protein
MRSLKKINLKKYFALTILSTAASLFFLSSIEEVYGVLIVFFGTVVNQLMLIESVMMVVDMGNGKSVDKIQLVTMFFGKFIVLFGALYLGWHFMGNRVIIPVINYVLHIFFLTLSSKKES